MESDLQQQQQMSSSLLRYRSAPSSYFSNFLESEDCEEFLNHRPSSPETERIISRFFESPTHNLIENRDDSPFIAPMKLEEEETVLPQQQSNYSSASQMMFHSNMDRVEQMKMGSVGSNSNLVRHSSSPAGLFANVNIENGFVTMRGMANFGNANGNTSGEASFSSSTCRMKNQMNYGSGPPSSSGLMSPIAEHGNKNMGILTSPENENFTENHSSGNFITGFPVSSWDDSRLMTESFSGMKRPRDDSISGINALNSQSEGSGNHPTHLLSHHLSLPKTSAEMASMEKRLQFHDSVPCKIRAKRGCATHPRSIAERVRRTRISERMRKLQELVPNMDTQTNTADMLDLAVDYIKDLQKEVQTLANNRSKCTCCTNQDL